MKFEEHCHECILKLGEAFEQVHNWLDEYASQPPYGMRHRRVRHHLKGIEEIRKKWGNKAAEAARLHIISDLNMDQWREGVDPFPRDESHYVEMGLF